MCLWPQEVRRVYRPASTTKVKRSLGQNIRIELSVKGSSWRPQVLETSFEKQRYYGDIWPKIRPPMALESRRARLKVNSFEINGGPENGKHCRVLIEA